MKTTMKMLVAAAVGLCTSIAIAVTNVVLLAGESYVVIGSGADALNVRGSTIDAHGGATIVCKPTDGTSYTSCWYSLQATNGIVTLDVTADAAAGLIRRLRAVYTSGTGGFRVKGATQIDAGRSDEGADAAPFDAANFGFVDDDGNAVAGTVHFKGTSCIVKAPAAEKCTWTIDSDDVAIAGTNALGLAAGETFAPSRGFNIFTDTAVPASSAIQIPAGKTVTIKPSVPAPFGGTVAQSAAWGGNANNFVLGGNSHLVFHERLTNFTGTVSGSGSVVPDGNCSICRVPVSGDVSALTIAPGMAAVVEEGASATFSVGSSALIRSDGGSIALAGESWRDSVALWFDPSQTETCHNVGRTTSYDGESCAGKYDLFYTNRYPLIEAVDDCRASQTSWRLRNNRLTSNGAPNSNIFPHVYPYLVTNGLNGLSYICCGEYSSAGTRKYTRNNNGTESDVNSTSSEQRRLMIQEVGGENQDQTYGIKSVVMVFGSAFGGGAAMLGTYTRALGRGADFSHAPSDPITTNQSVSVWIDGRSIDPAETTFNASGWQIVSVSSPSAMSFTALGMPGRSGASDWQKSGGQCYGEMMFFADEITDVQRVAAERYLARKWGLVSQYGGPGPARAELYGTGSVDATEVGELTLGGSFSGTLTLAGGEIAIPDEPLPYTENTLPADGRVGWFDPSVRTAVYTRKDHAPNSGRPDEIYAIWEREAEPYKTGTRLLWGVGERLPTLRQEARGVGPVCNWIDYNHFYDYSRTAQNSGNAMRVVGWQDGMAIQTGDTSHDAPIPARTVFIVQDSVRGGGTPVLDNISAGGKIKNRARGNVSAPIFTDDTDSNIRDGLIHLNGVETDRSSGFTGRPEVFSFTTVSDLFNVGFFANFYNTQEYDNGEIQGEILLYGREVTGTERLAIEAYLMRKWLGWLPSGFSDVSGVTVAGEGAVSAPSAARLPSFAQDFKGDIQVASGDFTFTYDSAETPIIGGGCVISAPLATLALPAACTASVTFATPPAEGSYALITSAGFKTPVTWTLAVAGPAGGRPVNLRSEGGCLYLDVQQGGMTVIVR